MATAPSKLITVSTASSSSSASTAPSSSSVSASASSSAAVSGDFSFLGGAGSSALRAPVGGFRIPVGEVRKRLVANLILDLADNNRREDALARLSVMRETSNDLAPLLWYSFGTVAILLQEIVSVYSMLSPPTLTLIQSNRVSNALALLQCVASHSETRTHLIKACIPLYLYPLLDTTCETRPFEYMRLTSLGVIGALVKVPDTEVILFLLSSEIMPLCLRSMENGSELSRTVATFILQKILLDDVGLEYVCSLPERLFAVNLALGNVIAALVDQPSARLLKHVLRCYLRFSEDERSLWALRCSLPKRLTDGTFNRCLWEDQTARMWLQQFLDNIRGPPVVQGTVTNNLMRKLLCAM